MKSAKLVRLKWRDRTGVIERELPVSRSCPGCGLRRARRADTHELCTSLHYVPVECRRCLTGSYYALPVAELEQLRTLEEFRRTGQFTARLPERSLRERMNDAIQGFWDGWRGP